MREQFTSGTRFFDGRCRRAAVQTSSYRCGARWRQAMNYPLRKAISVEVRHAWRLQSRGGGLEGKRP